MPKYERSLQKFISMVNAASDGRTKIMLMGTIQKYLDQQSLSILEDEINSLTNLKDVNLLLGSGPKGLVNIAIQAKKIGLMASLPLRPTSFANVETDSTPT